MDEGTRLALCAILQGLHRSGQLGAHALAVIVDELRYASREARDMLFDHAAVQIDRLAADLHHACADRKTETDPVSDQIRRLRDRFDVCIPPSAERHA